jgi:1-aminocyclopropane-1-carboxylate deaminase
MQIIPQDIRLDAITTDPVSIPVFSCRQIQVEVLRLDKIHPLISGNKWFKLQYYLQQAIHQNKKRILTFGGAWSNHIIATAAACRLFQIPCTGLIRGEEPSSLSPVLTAAKELGMELCFLSRTDYANEQIPSHLIQPEHLFIAAGGYGTTGVSGAADILNYCKNKETFTHICCAAGTGTMMAGLLKAKENHQKITGISVMRNNHSLENEMTRLISSLPLKYTLHHDYHFGGYAKYTDGLIQSMNDWYRQTGIPTDFVYTGKLMYAICDLAAKDYFPAGSKLLLIHSGGLTGNASLSKGKLIF